MNRKRLWGFATMAAAFIFCFLSGPLTGYDDTVGVVVAMAVLIAGLSISASFFIKANEVEHARPCQENMNRLKEEDISYLPYQESLRN